jgi:hypothetical protein
MLVHIEPGVWHLLTLVLQTRPPEQVLPEQQAAPTRLQVELFWHLLETHCRPALHWLPGIVHGWLRPPVVCPLVDLQVCEAASQVKAALRHGIPVLQQAWPVSPQPALQVPAVQVRPLLQAIASQHAWPAVPQGLHMPETQTLPEVQVLLGEQQALPTSPHMPVGLSQTPALQVSPAQQSPGAPQAAPIAVQHLPAVQDRPAQQSCGPAQALPVAAQQPPVFGLHCRPTSQTEPLQHCCAAPPQLPLVGPPSKLGIEVPPSRLVGVPPGGGAVQLTTKANPSITAR